MVGLTNDTTSRVTLNRHSPVNKNYQIVTSYRVLEQSRLIKEEYKFAKFGIISVE